MIIAGKFSVVINGDSGNSRVDTAEIYPREYRSEQRDDRRQDYPYSGACRFYIVVELFGRVKALHAAFSENCFLHSIISLLADPASSEEMTVRVFNTTIFKISLIRAADELETFMTAVFAFIKFIVFVLRIKSDKVIIMTVILVLGTVR